MAAPLHVTPWGEEVGKEAVIEIWPDGIVTHSECCGCTSETLDDRPQILSLYHALGDWLMSHPAESS